MTPKERTIARLVRETVAKCEPARLDQDRTARPKTRLVGHARVGDCVGPGSVQPDALEDQETGSRTPLKGE